MADQDDKLYLQRIHPWMEGLTIELLKNKPPNPIESAVPWLRTNSQKVPKPTPDERMLQNRAANREYLVTLHPIFEGLVMELLGKKPVDAPTFMATWLEQYARGSQSNASGSNKAAPKGGKSTFAGKNAPAGRNANPEHSDPEENEDDYIDDGDLRKKKNVQQSRAGVSAEVYGPSNPKGNFKPRTIPKSADQSTRIAQRLQQAFMFASLDQKVRDIVVNAMEEKKFSKGQDVISQGQDGAELYVVDSGELDCFRQMKPGEKPTLLRSYQAGDSFGELALLYNAPRAATITAKTDAVLWALDRDTFNNIVKDAAIKKRERYESILQQIELLKSMDPYERSQVADILVPKLFKKGEAIFKQGDQGNDFFMVEEGELVATINANEAMQYKQGDYFGELALLNNTPRAATVTAKTDCKLMSLERDAFKRVMGPLEEILKRNAGNYKKFSK